MVQTRRNQQRENLETVSLSDDSRTRQATGGPARASRAKEIEMSVEEELAKSQASRNQAEGERQRIASSILDATREACQELISDGEKVLKRAKRLEGDAERKNQKAQATVERANAIKVEADAYAEKVMSSADTIKQDADTYYEKAVAEAKAQAEELLEMARTSAQRECTELKQQASFEAKQMLAQAQVIRAAAQEELEAHRIYAEAARLNAESHEVLVHARAKLDEYSSSGDDILAQASSPRPAAATRKDTSKPDPIDTLAKEAAAIKKMSAKVGRGGTKAAASSSSKKKPSSRSKAATDSSSKSGSKSSSGSKAGARA